MLRRSPYSSRYKWEIMRCACRLTGPQCRGSAPFKTHTYSNGSGMSQMTGAINNPSGMGASTSKTEVAATDGLPLSAYSKPPAVISAARSPEKYLAASPEPRPVFPLEASLEIPPACGEACDTAGHLPYPLGKPPIEVSPLEKPRASLHAISLEYQIESPTVFAEAQAFANPPLSALESSPVCEEAREMAKRLESTIVKPALENHPEAQLAAPATQLVFPQEHQLSPPPVYEQTREMAEHPAHPLEKRPRLRLVAPLESRQEPPPSRAEAQETVHRLPPLPGKTSAPRLADSTQRQPAISRTPYLESSLACAGTQATAVHPLAMLEEPPLEKPHALYPAIPPESWIEPPTKCAEEPSTAVHPLLSLEKFPESRLFVPQGHQTDPPPACAEAQPSECPASSLPEIKTKPVGPVFDCVNPKPPTDHCHDGEGVEQRRGMPQNARESDPGDQKANEKTEANEESAKHKQKKREHGEPDKCAPCSSLFQTLQYDDTIDPCGEGLLYYQKFWYLNEVEICVKGELLYGTALEFHQNTLRLINDTHSYYIPLRQVDYIRTGDGLKTCFTDGRFGPVPPLRVEG